MTRALFNWQGVHIWQFPLKMLHPQNPPNPETQIPRYNFKVVCSYGACHPRFGIPSRRQCFMGFFRVILFWFCLPDILSKHHHKTLISEKSADRRSFRCFVAFSARARQIAKFRSTQNSGPGNRVKWRPRDGTLGGAQQRRLRPLRRRAPNQNCNLNWYREIPRNLSFSIIYYQHSILLICWRVSFQSQSVDSIWCGLIVVALHQEDKLFLTKGGTGGLCNSKSFQ